MIPGKEILFLFVLSKMKEKHHVNYLMRKKRKIEREHEGRNGPATYILYIKPCQGRAFEMRVQQKSLSF